MSKLIFEYPLFRALSTNAKLLYMQACQQRSPKGWVTYKGFTPLGITVVRIEDLAEQVNIETNQYWDALGELEVCGFAEYDRETHTIWLPTYFDYYRKPNNPNNFGNHLTSHFDDIPWSKTKQKCGKDLRKRAKEWGEGYEAKADAFIAHMIRKPRKSSTRLADIKLIKFPSKDGDLDTDER